MSTAHRTPKHIKFKHGKLCPKCGKSKLEKAKCAKVGNRGHESHCFCPTCKAVNF